MSTKTPTTYLPLYPYMASQPGSVLAEGEITIVNFAGFGGSCEGIAQAMNRPPDYAINHDPVALALHRSNSPHTTHLVQDVWDVDPLELVGNRKIALAWFSPDCRHFSKAKGGVPVEKRIRDLAWVTTKYTGMPADVKPRLVILENVEEFTTWGPLGEEGRPDKARAGETFREFIATLEAHGYEVQWRMLKADEYGTPTTRKRFFLIARSDGQEIVWPEPTHGRPDHPEVLSGKRRVWRTAAECIDWSLPTPSIFTRRRPLVAATLRRTARGLKRFVKEAQQPYIVTCNHGGQSIYEPMKTITAAYDAHGLVDPLLMPFLTNKQFGNPSRPVAAPLSTITTNHNKSELVTANLKSAAFLQTFYGAKSATDVRGQTLSTPLATQTTENRHALMSVSLVKHYGGFYQGAGISLNTPISTITSVDHHALLTASLLKYYGSGTGQPMNAPLDTVTTRDRFGLTCATLTRHFGASRAADVGAPLGTITADGGGKTGLVQAYCLPGLTPEEMLTARKVYALMVEYAPDALTVEDHAAGVVFVQVGGTPYVIADVGMRMLTPRELARCQGFEDRFVLEHTPEGVPVSKAAQVRCIGNSVCPPVATALVKAQFQFGEAAD